MVIYYDSSMSANLQAKFINGKTLGVDREALFYLDSMMKKKLPSTLRQLLGNRIPLDAKLSS